VGAFQDAANAARLAARLTQEKYPLQRAAVTEPSAGGGGHEVLVVGASADEINDKLQGTTRKAVGTREGVLIQPALPLKDAVALSQELRADGLTVKIRRALGTAGLHTVRVGAYSSRSKAEAVRKELQEKGLSGFIVQEPGGGR
jgi:cell division septation protein DedD